jgi:hypothetical protein
VGGGGLGLGLVTDTILALESLANMRTDRKPKNTFEFLFRNSDPTEGVQTD